MNRPVYDVMCPKCRWNTKRTLASDGRTRRDRSPGAIYGYCRACQLPLALRSSLVDPMWRQRAGAKAGIKNRQRAQQRRMAIGLRYKDRGLAYQAGYRQGYYTGMQWWRKRYHQLQKRVNEQLKGAA